MVRYLSPEWLARLPEAGSGATPDGGGAGSAGSGTRPAGAGAGAAGAGAGAAGAGGRGATQGGGAAAPAVVTVRHVVHGTPEGEASYDLSVDGGQVTLCRAAPTPADVTFNTDYRTAAAIASGSLSTQRALAEGRLKVKGDLRVLAGLATAAAGADALPPDLRADTEFPR